MAASAPFTVSGVKAGSARRLFKPRFCGNPVAFHSRSRYVQRRGRFFDRESAKELELDHATQARIERLEGAERLIEGQYIDSDCRCHGRCVTKADHRDVTASLVSVAAAGIVDQHLPHETRCQCEEMRAILQCHPIDVDKPQVDLVDQLRRLQRVARPLRAQARACHAPQFRVDHRQ